MKQKRGVGLEGIGIGFNFSLERVLHVPLFPLICLVSRKFVGNVIIRSVFGTIFSRSIFIENIVFKIVFKIIFYQVFL